MESFIVNSHIIVNHLLDLTLDDPLGSAALFEALIEFSKQSEENNWMALVASSLINTRPECKEFIKIDYLENCQLHQFFIITPREDYFGPYNFNIQMPDVPVRIIDTEAAVKDLNFTDRWIVALDSEWKLQLGKYSFTKVSILQIGFPEEVYIIDMLKLHDCEALKSKLYQLLANDNILKVGIAFDGDMTKLKDSYKNFICFSEPVNNYVDLVNVYKKTFEKNPGSLANLAELLIETTMCKVDQKSNWELRPLKLSQLHYAALDVYICLNIYQKFVDTKVDVRAFAHQINGNSSEKEKNSYQTLPSCDNCKSKLHTTNCPITKKCLFCGVNQHVANECPCLVFK